MAMSRQVGSALGVAILVAIVGTGAATAATFHGAWLFMGFAGLGAAVLLGSVGPLSAEDPVVESAGLTAEVPV